MFKSFEYKLDHLTGRTADAGLLCSEMSIDAAKLFVGIMPQVKENTP
ncbi:MAG: hypothetical protein WC496_02215 [Phycisphaerae bacterium]